MGNNIKNIVKKKEVMRVWNGFTWLWMSDWALRWTPLYGVD